MVWSPLLWRRNIPGLRVGHESVRVIVNLFNNIIDRVQNVRCIRVSRLLSLRPHVPKTL